jgi:hypothetical protein
MARYEEMDEILQRVRMRLAQERVGPSATAIRPLPTMTVPLSDRTYEEILAAMQHLLSDAEQLTERLDAEAARNLEPQQRGHLVSRLGDVVQELRNCEAALRARTPRT